MQNDAELWPNLGVVWRCRDQASWDLAKSFQDILQDSFRLSSLSENFSEMSYKRCNTKKLAKASAEREDKLQPLKG